MLTVPLPAAIARHDARRPWTTVRAAVLVVVACVGLFGGASFLRLCFEPSDALLVASMDAGRLVQNGAMIDPGQSTPRLIPKTALLVDAAPAWTYPELAARLVPDPGRRNPPPEGDYAFTRTRLRTLSPLCRIACG